MITKPVLGLAAAFLAASFGFIPPTAQAQRMAAGGIRSGGMRAPAQTPHARPAFARSQGFRTGAAHPANSRLVGPGFIPGSFGYGNGYGNLGVEALIDPATQWNIALAQRLGRFRGGSGASGFYLLNGGYVGPYYSDDSEPASSASYDPQPSPGPANQPIFQQPDQYSSNPYPAPPVVQQSAPLPDVGQFTLVLRSGAKIQAIGFTRMGDKLIYITVEGNRRTMNISDLNPDATRQINEERGTPLQLTL
jgi:hypothetical protein